MEMLPSPSILFAGPCSTPVSAHVFQIYDDLFKGKKRDAEGIKSVVFASMNLRSSWCT